MSGVVTPFKKPLSNLRENKIFNYHLSRVSLFEANAIHLLTDRQVRVKSEHAMGYIKGRFCSLRGLRQQIDSPQDHQRAIAWIKACIVLHTLIFFIEHGHEDLDYIERLVERGNRRTGEDSSLVTDEIEAEAVRETRGQRKREELKAHILECVDESDEEII